MDSTDRAGDADVLISAIGVPSMSVTNWFDEPVSNLKTVGVELFGEGRRSSGARDDRHSLPCAGMEYKACCANWHTIPARDHAGRLAPREFDG